jgi:hypothetical protein
MAEWGRRPRRLLVRLIWRHGVVLFVCALKEEAREILQSCLPWRVAVSHKWVRGSQLRQATYHQYVRTEGLLGYVEDAILCLHTIILSCMYLGRHTFKLEPCRVGWGNIYLG